MNVWTDGQICCIAEQMAGHLLKRAFVSFGRETEFLHTFIGEDVFIFLQLCSGSDAAEGSLDQEGRWRLPLL